MNKRASPQPGGSSLTRLCVSRDEDRPARHLAWAGSVCVLVLAVGVAGFTLPPFSAMEPRLREQIVPVVFTAPERPPAEKISLTTSQTTEPEKSVPAPLVASVANISGPVALASPMDMVALPAAMPVTQQDAAASTGFTQFNAATNGGNMPQPVYPEIARHRSYQGKVVVNFTVAASGEVVKAEVGRSSGFNVLDDAAVEAVRNRWIFGPGDLRHHFVEITFQLK